MTLINELLGWWAAALATVVLAFMAYSCPCACHQPEPAYGPQHCKPKEAH